MALTRLLWLVAPPLCWACGAPARHPEPLCRQCRPTLRWLGPEPALTAGVSVWAPVAYDGAARALVHALKFQGATGVAESMAAQIVACAPAALLADATLVPVPLHPGRLRRRGFNQAERLAAAVARRAGLARRACLVRRGPAVAQVGRGRADRLGALEGLIELRAAAVPPRRALLVDDVVTTGATLRACSRALRSGGTERVAAIAYARTPGR